MALRFMQGPNYVCQDPLVLVLTNETLFGQSHSFTSHPGLSQCKFFNFETSDQTKDINFETWDQTKDIIFEVGSYTW